MLSRSSSGRRALAPANALKYHDLLQKKVRFNQMANKKRREAQQANIKSSKARARGLGESVVQKYRAEKADLRALANRYAAGSSTIMAELNRILRGV
jgi:hypothetical protein